MMEGKEKQIKDPKCYQQSIENIPNVKKSMAALGAPPPGPCLPSVFLCLYSHLNSPSRALNKLYSTV
jgi:hypothetical protein